MFKKISAIKKAISNRIFKKKKNTIIILSGHSAIGKNTLATLLLKHHHDTKQVITATSRKPRSYETKGDYIFLTEKKFKTKIRKNAFLEYSQVYGFYYGVLKTEFEKVQKQFSYTLLILDTVGSQKIIAYAQTNNLVYKSVFLTTKSLQNIEDRMILRGDDKTQRDYRLKEIEKELEMSKQFDKKIYNDHLNTCFQKLQDFIYSY